MEQKDIIDHLKQEHKSLKDLLTQAESAKDKTSRNALVEKIEKSLIAHARAEEKVVYALILEATQKDASNELRALTNEGYEEHFTADNVLKELKGIDPSSERWLATLKVLKENVEHHIKEEEKNMFPKIKSKYDLESRKEINAQFVETKEKYEESLPSQRQIDARTRP